MNLINNWMQPVTLAAGATAIELDLPDGSYRLSITDSATAPTRWEIVGAAVASGAAVLARRLEGTLDQDWPAGSVIYAGITAGMLGELYQRISSLEARVTALEPPISGLMVTVGQFQESSSQTRYGFTDDPVLGSMGGIVPATVDVPGVGAAPVMIAAYDDYGSFVLFTLRLEGVHAKEVLQSVALEGGATLQVATADFDNSSGFTSWFWMLETMQPVWAPGEQRRIIPTFA